MIWIFFPPADAVGGGDDNHDGEMGSCQFTEELSGSGVGGGGLFYHWLGFLQEG